MEYTSYIWETCTHTALWTEAFRLHSFPLLTDCLPFLKFGCNIAAISIYCRYFPVRCSFGLKCMPPLFLRPRYTKISILAHLYTVQIPIHELTSVFIFLSLSGTALLYLYFILLMTWMVKVLVLRYFLDEYLSRFGHFFCQSSDYLFSSPFWFAFKRLCLL